METEINTTHTFDLSNRFFNVAIVVAVALVILCLAAAYYEFNNVPQNTPHEITVSGAGKAYVKPDIALVTFGVTTQAVKSQDAVNQNNTKMNAVITAVKALGVADADIQTTSYNLSPTYGYSRIPQPMPMVSGGSAASGTVGVAMPNYIIGGQVLTGYSLEQDISVK